VPSPNGDLVFPFPVSRHWRAGLQIVPSQRDFAHLGSMMEQRALRYVDDAELGRARMAPPFEFTTIDGQHYSLDDLQGEVVLMPLCK
jgi:hypothetical protein